jgi:ABC-2 type transport system permease protein
MSVMYLLFAANTASTFFLAERADGTLNRMLAFPITRLQVILGKLGGVVVLGVGQLALLFGFSHFVYDVDFGSSPLGFALMIVASVVAAMGVGAVISAVGRDPEVADQLGVIVILVMSMVGGCMLPSYLFPSWMNKLSFLTFNRWSIEGFFTIMFRGGTVQDVWLHAAVLFGMGLAALAVAVPLTRFERS